MRRALAVMAALAIALAGVVAAPEAARAQEWGEPAFEVHLYPGESGGLVFVKFWPAANTLTVTVDDPATTQSPDYETEVVPVETDNDGLGGGFGVPYSIRPGDVVTVTDGTTTRSHTVIDIRVTSVDVDADQVAGTVAATVAASGSDVIVYLETWGGCWRQVTASPTGNWMADFSVAGPDECLFNLVPGTSGGAEQADADGDSTVYHWQVRRPDGWQHNPATGHDYLYVDAGMTWAEAEAYAVSLGGHLVTINDAAEDAWLVETLGTEYLIGLNDVAAEGVWRWASGEPVPFTNWCPDEPNDLAPGEDVVMIWNRPPIGWNDVPAFSVMPFVVEVVPTLDQLLDDMVADGRLPNDGVAASILKQAEKAPLKALRSHLSDLVRRGVITQVTMNQILAIVTR